MRKVFRFENDRISQYGFIICDKIDKTINVSDLIENAALRGLCENSKIVLTLPILTVSEANGLLSKTRFYKNGKPKPEHWTESSARHKSQKNSIYFALSPQKHLIKMPCVVKMTRLAPRELDADDNLRISVKWIKDAIAELITGDYVPGRADGDKRITWQYDQEKCPEYKVKIEISW